MADLFAPKTQPQTQQVKGKNGGIDLLAPQGQATDTTPKSDVGWFHGMVQEASTPFKQAASSFHGVLQGAGALAGAGTYGIGKIVGSEAIKKKGIELIVLKTQEAIEEFNELSKTKRVNALIHTTC